MKSIQKRQKRRYFRFFGLLFHKNKLRKICSVKIFAQPIERKRDIEVAIIRMVINDVRIARFLLNGMA
jgi:hypothetical protein